MAAAAVAAAKASVECFAGKCAIITGGASGIGLACAAALGARGARVVLADIDGTKAATAAGSLGKEGITAIGHQTDVSSAESVAALVKAAGDAYGGVDVLVTSAGIVKAADFLEMTEADYDAVMNVNVKGTFLCCQAAAKDMVARGKEGGSIVTIGSVNGMQAIPAIAGYNASKGAVHNLTRCMALALADKNIRVNCIAPGSIMTDVLRAVADDETKMKGILSRTPMGRAGEPSEVAEAVAWIASPLASYSTGEVVYLSGGRLALNYTVPVQGEGFSGTFSKKRKTGD